MKGGKERWGGGDEGREGEVGRGGMKGGKERWGGRDEGREGEVERGG